MTTKKFSCTHFRRISERITATDGSGLSYVDTYLRCTKLNKRITKKYCIGCKCYEPLKTQTY